MGVKEGLTKAVKYVYSVSDVHGLVQHAIRSIKSLHRLGERKEDIIVFLTPPRSKLNTAMLGKLATVKEVDNVTKPFEFKPNTGLQRYGEKCHLCDVDASTVIFLDADVIVRKDLRALVIGDYDFAARKQYPTKQLWKEGIDDEGWRSLFRNYPIVPMPNAGFMIFKNYTHRKIKNKWLSLINSDLPNPCRHGNPKDQTTIAMALAGKKIKWLTAYEHAYGWFHEDKTVDSYVVHKKSFFTSLLGQALHLTSKMLGD